MVHVWNFQIVDQEGSFQIYLSDHLGVGIFSEQIYFATHHFFDNLMRGLVKKVDHTSSLVWK